MDVVRRLCLHYGLDDALAADFLCVSTFLVKLSESLVSPLTHVSTRHNMFKHNLVATDRALLGHLVVIDS